jgi:hypothetical protein
MADIFGTQIPPWLQEITLGDRNGWIGKAAVTALGGGIGAAVKASDEDEKRNWFQLLPESIADARMSIMDPAYKIKLQQMQLGIANTALQMQETQQKIALNASELQAEAQDLKAIPPWMATHNSPDSWLGATDRPVPSSKKWQAVMYQRDQAATAAVRANAQTVLEKTTFNGLKELSNAVDEISKYDGIKGGALSAKIRPFAAKGEMPPAEILQEVSIAREGAQTKKLGQDKELITARGTGTPVGARYLTMAEQEGELAESFRLKGDTANYQLHKERADQYRSLAIPKGVVSQMGYDDQGRPIMTTSVGGAQPTVGTQTMTQQKQISFEMATEGINDIVSKLRPSDVGVAGVAGEQVFDRWLGQIDPKLVSGERVTNRRALGALRENLFQALSPERIGGSGFSNKDAERIKEIASSLEAAHSYGEVVTSLNTIRGIIRDRSRVYAERTGQPVPDFAKKPEELQTEYVNRLNAIQKALDNFTITREQAETEGKEAAARAADALKRFHGINASFK